MPASGKYPSQSNNPLQPLFEYSPESQQTLEGSLLNASAHDNVSDIFKDEVETEVDLERSIPSPSPNDIDNDFLYKVSWRPNSSSTNNGGNPDDLYS